MIRSAELRRVSYLSRTYEFNRPVTIERYTEDDLILIDCEEFAAIGVGESYDEALECFKKDFDGMYNGLMVTPDDEISDKLVKRKEALMMLTK